MPDELNDLRKRGELLWQDESAPARGPRRSLSAGDVVQAAIGIADAQGIAAVTMQAVAKELGVTPMALYRYFPSKDALIDAIVDAAMGEPPPRTGPPGAWREEVARWAWAKRAMLMSHPWLGELPFVAAPHGPNWLAWLEGAVEALDFTGLDSVAVLDTLHVLDGYVRGGSDTAISLAKARSRGTSDSEWGAAISADLLRAIGNPRYPTLSKLFTSEGQQRTAALGGTDLMDGLAQNFEFGLARVLDGIERYMEHRAESDDGIARGGERGERGET